MCVLAPRSMGANKFGLAASFMQNGELMVTDKKEGMRQEKEGRSQSHKRGVWGSIHLSDISCQRTGSAPMHSAQIASY